MGFWTTLLGVLLGSTVGVLLAEATKRYGWHGGIEWARKARGIATFRKVLVHDPLAVAAILDAINGLKPMSYALLDASAMARYRNSCLDQVRTSLALIAPGQEINMDPVVKAMAYPEKEYRRAARALARDVPAMREFWTFLPQKTREEYGGFPERPPGPEVV